MRPTLTMPAPDTLPEAGNSVPALLERSPIDSAQARLAASRSRLRLALMPPDPDSAQAHASGTGRKPHRLGAMWRAWRRSMHSWPVVDLALDTAQTWWQRQPLRPVGELLAAELRATALPLVRKHPLATVVAAGALGVLLVAGRPWRWPLVAKQMHRAPHHVGNWLTRQLGSASVQASLIGMLMVWARRPPAAPVDGQPKTASDLPADHQSSHQPDRQQDRPHPGQHHHQPAAETRPRQPAQA